MKAACEKGSSSIEAQRNRVVNRPAVESRLVYLSKVQLLYNRITYGVEG